MWGILPIRTVIINPRLIKHVLLYLIIIYLAPHRLTDFVLPVEALNTPPEATESLRLNDFPKNGCSCVSYVRSKISSLPLGNAVSLLPNSIYPVKGGVVKLSYQVPGEYNVNKYHLAYVESVQADGIHISEQCYGSNEVTRRVIPFKDDHIRGYWSPNI